LRRNLHKLVWFAFTNEHITESPSNKAKLTQTAEPYRKEQEAEKELYQFDRVSGRVSYGLSHLIDYVKLTNGDEKPREVYERLHVDFIVNYMKRMKILIN